MRWLTAAATIGLIILAGCGSPTPKAPPKAAASPTYSAPQCRDVLAQIPAKPPATVGQATVLVKALSVDQGIGGTIPSGTLLRSLTNTVAADALKLSFDVGPLGGNTTSDLATYNSDVAQLRSYCRGS